MCDKLLIDVFVFHSIPDLCKSQEMCERVIHEDPFIRIHHPNRTQKLK